PANGVFTRFHSDVSCQYRPAGNASSSRQYVGKCAGFRTPACRDYRRAPTAGCRKAPRQEIAVGGSAAARRGLWGVSGGTRGAALGLHVAREDFEVTAGESSAALRAWTVPAESRQE